MCVCYDIKDKSRVINLITLNEQVLWTRTTQDEEDCDEVGH